MIDGNGVSTTTEECPAVKLDSILAAAIDLFDRLGYEKVTVEDVATRAHVSKKTLYKKYDDKRGLLGAIAATFADQFGKHVDAFSGRHHDPEIERLCTDVGGGGGQVGN
ncbi:MAG: helix-turn-helix transcriptional regulator [Deltaproteobacteria bacterium]|nr:helix-turn-helix transcriptional regulator [Deltaproteobacteria bacterium]